MTKPKMERCLLCGDPVEYLPGGYGDLRLYYREGGRLVQAGHAHRTCHARAVKRPGHFWSNR